MERYVGKHQKEPGHQTRDTASPVDNVRSPGLKAVRNHVSAVLAKFGVSTRAEAVVKAHQGIGGQTDWPGPSA